MGVPGASRCPVGHTPVERAPGAMGPCGAGLGTRASPQGAPPWGRWACGSPEEASGRGHRPGLPPNGAALGGSALASFCAILAVFWAVFAPLGPFGAFWALFRPFWALLVPL